MNNESAASPEGRGNLNGFYSYKNTFDKDSVWLDVPKHGRIEIVSTGGMFLLILSSHLRRQLRPVRR
jgi:hypothetical protein